MREELGDVLMQVVLQAQIAEEEGLFTLEDVIGGISEKMIRRHPHVFYPDGTPLDGAKPESVPSWDEIKKEEKKSQSFRESKLKKRTRKIFAKFYQLFL
jgi:tetrapyrrole methylase family protein/MazG family protein